MKIRNINEEPLEESRNTQGEMWRRIDLSGEHLGVKIEELQPGEHSSVHHYHTIEEEHLIMLEGTATLVLDEAKQELSPGDHVCFLAGTGEAHHLVNRSEDKCRYLVFGERQEGDVVFYPKGSVMLVKTPEFQVYRYSDYEI